MYFTNRKIWRYKNSNNTYSYYAQLRPVVYKKALWRPVKKCFGIWVADPTLKDFRLDMYGFEKI
jgi:hypothetical protein